MTAEPEPRPLREYPHIVVAMWGLYILFRSLGFAQSEIRGAADGDNGVGIVLYAQGRSCAVRVGSVVSQIATLSQWLDLTLRFPDLSDKEASKAYNGAVSSSEKERLLALIKKIGFVFPYSLN